MARLGKARIKAVPTGIAHGTVTAVIHGRPIEVTTLRRDVETDGRHAVVAFTDDWREDAARRDFTINALSAEPEGGVIHDYFGGLADIGARRVRFIGDPLRRIAEDHLRILRFFRFHARFGEGQPDQAGTDACAARANDLMALSRERIADELMKLLALPDPAPTVALMIERGILRPVLPELEEREISALASLPQRERAALIEPHAIRRLAALLPRGRSVVADIAARLRLSKSNRWRLMCVSDRLGTSSNDPRRLAYKYDIDIAIDRLLLDPSLNRAEAAKRIDEIRNWSRPKLPISGGELIRMGLQPGPVVAATMQAIEAEWIELGFPNDKAAVRALAQGHVAQALRSRQ
jgi:poly(A) polymerase